MFTAIIINRQGVQAAFPLFDRSGEKIDSLPLPRRGDLIVAPEFLGCQIVEDIVFRLDGSGIIHIKVRRLDKSDLKVGEKTDAELAQEVIDCANAADASPAPAPAPSEEYVISDIDGRFYNAATGDWERKCATRYSFLTNLPCVIFGPPPRRETLTAAMNDADEVVYVNSENRGTAWSEKWSQVAWKMVGDDKR
jgi:hypothetical protein